MSILDAGCRCGAPRARRQGRSGKTGFQQGLHRGLHRVVQQGASSNPCRRPKPPRGGCGQFARRGGTDAQRRRATRASARQSVPGSGLPPRRFLYPDRFSRTAPAPPQQRGGRGGPCHPVGQRRHGPGRPDSGPVSDAEDEPGDKPGRAQPRSTPKLPDRVKPSEIPLRQAMDYLCDFFAPGSDCLKAVITFAAPPSPSCLAPTGITSSRVQVASVRAVRMRQPPPRHGWASRV